jgi:predicted glycosyltransferase
LGVLRYCSSVGIPCSILFACQLYAALISLSSIDTGIPAQYHLFVGKRILFISGSLGLGHISRDMAITRELCKQRTDLDIHWLAAEPARSVIEQAGEKLVGEIELYRNDNIKAESAAKGTRLNLFKYAFSALNAWLHNAHLVKKIVEQGQYDLLIGDETYEIIVATVLKRLKLNIPFLMLYDFLGLDAMSRNPLENFGIYFWNRIWSLDHKIFNREKNIALFIGEPEDIPDKRFGLFLANRREYALKNYNFVGYIITFEPKDFADKIRFRNKLGYDERPLVVCSIGGTSVGRDLLELCGKAYVLAKQKIPNLHMILVCGPRLPKETLDVPKDQDLEVRQYVPDLHEHFAACDLAVVQGGGTTTLELTALHRPFIYFPIEGHSEQEIVVAERLQRHQSGIRMSYADSTENSLSDAIVANIHSRVKYRDVPIHGAYNVVQFINKLI